MNINFIKMHNPTNASADFAGKSHDQTFHVVKIAFPRGDAASLMLGFNARGKITGITLMSMAGD